MSKPGLVCLPSTPMGHLIPMVELATQLQTRFSVTVLLIPHLHPAWAQAAASYMESVSASGLDIRFEELPRRVDPTTVDLMLETQTPGTFVTRLMEAYTSPVKESLSSRPDNTTAALVLDLFCTTMIDMADELGIPAYIYYTSNAALLGYVLYLPTLHAKLPCQLIKDDVEGDVVDVDIPGLPPVPPHCIPPFLMDKEDEAYTIFLNHSHLYRRAKGIIVNTFAALEPGPLRAIANGDCLPSHSTPPVFAVGPILAVEPRCAEHECIRWLDGQPAASVVFLCFGTMGCFGAGQVREMAVGLERSGHRFLWALRSPSSGRIPMPTDADLEEALPEGFLEGSKGRGMVWPSWVPQAEILSHEAVGGFVTHGGWNSCLEGLWFGVPMLAWPLQAEQHLNCLEMVRDVGVAVELKLDSGFVSSEELERGVRSLMEECEVGKKVRAKVEEMKEASRRATTEGGSSYVALQRLMSQLIDKEKTTAEIDDCCMSHPILDAT